MKTNQKFVLNQKIDEVFSEYLSLSEEEKASFLKKAKDEDEDFISKLLETMRRIDGARKSKILGRLLAVTAKGEITPRDFSKLSFMIERTYIESLEYLIGLKSGQFTNGKYAVKTDKETEEHNNHLSIAGLMEYHTVPGRTIGDIGETYIHYELSSAGQMLAKYCGNDVT